MIEAHLIRALKDNYIAIVHDSRTNDALVIDPSEAAPVIAFLDQRGWKLSLILNTHHHWDHVGGNDELSSRYSCPIIASKIDGEKIHGVGRFVKDGETIEFGGDTIRAIHIPGHTLGHTAFYFENAKLVFAGDTLFSLGCGRLFEGTPEQMWSSLKKLMALPDETLLYCGHEYTLNNARFALTIEPQNMDLRRREAQAKILQEKSEPTIPIPLALEKKTNPFLRVDLPSVATAVGLSGRSADEIFTRLREMKNTF